MSLSNKSRIAHPDIKARVMVLRVSNLCQILCFSSDIPSLRSGAAAFWLKLLSFLIKELGSQNSNIANPNIVDEHRNSDDFSSAGMRKS